MKIELVPKLEGHYKMVATDVITGKQRIVADWFPNVITNIGLNRMGTGGVRDYCMVGSGNNVPTVFDTSLQSQVASTYISVNNSVSGRSSPPYYGIALKTFRFDPGAAAGNLSEVGIGWTTVDTFSRALILDTFGMPTTITILPSEYLDVIYELRMYVPTDDEFFEIYLEGVRHTVTMRASSATSTNWAPQLDADISFWSTNQTAYSGPIGDITSTPSGNSSSQYANHFSYENNSLTRKGYSIFGLDEANYAGGIKSFTMYTYYQIGSYQMQFDPPIPKDNTRTWRIDYGVTWARKD